VYKNGFNTGFDKPNMSTKNSLGKNVRLTLVKPSENFALKTPIEGSSDGVAKITDHNDAAKSFGEILYSKVGYINPNFPVEEKEYNVVLTFDKNKISKQDSRQLVQLYRNTRFDIEKNRPDLFEKCRFYLVPRHHWNSQGKIFSVMIRDNKHAETLFKYYIDNTDLPKVSEMETSLGPKFSEQKGHTYEYNFPENLPIAADHLTSFLDLIVEGVAPEGFKSQNEPKKVSFSRKIVGKNFEKKIVKSRKNQMLWLYSKNCHGCEKFGPVYEKIAQEYVKNSLDRTNSIKFNRMDNDENSMEGYRLYDSTPIFAMHKMGDHKSRPYIYADTKLNENLLRSWIDITSSFELIKNPDFLNNLEAKLQTWTENYDPNNFVTLDFPNI
jgi:thiol-disulfide isomerase/thioredoxin